MYLLLWIFWNVVYCVGCVSLWWCSVLVLSTSGTGCCVRADTIQYCMVRTIPWNSPASFTRTLSQFDLYTFYFMYSYRYLVSYKTNILEKSKETVNVCCWDLRLYFMFCSFVLNFGCLETSPEKPDFSKSGVHGGNGPRGSWLNSLCAIRCLYLCVYFGTYVTLWIIFYIPKNRVLKMVH